MRALPFPAEALYNREQSLDFASPGPGAANGIGVPPLGDVVPLDPSLSGPSSAPAYFTHVNGVNGVNGHGVQQGGLTHQLCPASLTYLYGQYPQGPEGDPFAPPPHLFPGPALGSAPDDRSEMSQKPVKRSRRKPRYEEGRCSFCSGDDNHNNGTGEPECMVKCCDCGRSGHPSCMQLGGMGETLRSYSWTCSDCKICEVCKKKSDDPRILICDNCDRGWHTYCLDPPLDGNPEGSWYCPQCPPPPESVPPTLEHQESQAEPELQIDPALQVEMDMTMEIDPALRGESVTSSTATSEPQGLTRSKTKAKPRTSVRVRDRKGKGRALILSDEEEEEVEVEALEEDEQPMYPISTPRGRAPPDRRRKLNARTRGTSETVPEDVVGPSPPLRPPKRMRLTMHSPSSSPPPRQRSAGRPKMVVRLRVSGKGKGREEDEEDELRKGMFDDFLDEQERDTSKTNIVNSDKERFEKARATAEAKLTLPPVIEPIDLSSIPGPSSGRFPLRSAVHQLQQQQTQALLSTPNSASPAPSTPGPTHANTKYDPSVLRIRTIRFGPYDIQTWYDAPFPEEFSNIPEGRLWICEFCLKYMKSRFGAQRHRLKCKCRHPPGDEIYRDGSISIFEVDGRKNKIYCQHLCLLSKMFLDHKSLFYDVEPFLFYVMTDVDEIGARFVGYFSKEKRSSKDLNLSCIMTLPVRQRQGWGNLLIDFSYLLSKKEHKCGTPERPLSALGAIGYKKYWTLALMRYLQNAPSNPRLEDISAATGMTIEDIYVTLMQQNMIIVHEGPSSPMRPSPGRSVKLNRSRKNGLARRNLQKAHPADDDKASKAPFVPPTSYEITRDADEVQQYLENWNAKGYLTLRPEKLKWIPFLLSRADKLVTPLEDALMTGPIDVENTPTTPTPGPTLSGALDATMSTSSSVKGSAVAMDVDTNNLSTPITPVSEPACSTSRGSRAASKHADTNSNAVNGKGDPTLVESEEHASRPEGSPTPTPSPPPTMPKSRSMNGLEALAAVAFAVSKANPVDVRKRSSTLLPLSVEISNPSRNWNGPNGSGGYPVPSLQDSAHSRSDQTSPLPETRSREVTAKTEENGPAFDGTMILNLNDEITAPQGRADGNSLPVPKLDRVDSYSSPSSDTLRVSVEQDAELAAQLAREENVRRRSLRSTSHSISATPTLAARESRPKETRKRQKAPSIRELSPPTPISPDRPTTRRQAHALAIETAKAGRMTRRQSSRLAANGGDNEALSIISSPSKRSTRLNGAPKSVAPQSPTKPIRNRTSSHRNSTRKGRTTRSRRGRSPSEESGREEPVKDEEGDVDAEGESDIDAEGEVDIAPSNETVSSQDQDAIVVANGVKSGVNGVLDKANDQDKNVTPTTSEIETMDMDVSAPVSVDAVADAATKMDVVVEDDDVDAEGEPDDEDADGEPDPDLIS